MTDEDFIVELFCRVDDKMENVPKHTQASLYPSELVAIAIVFAVKGTGNRAFYSWFKRNFIHLFPKLPERTRLFRLFNVHRDWTDIFMAEQSMLGIADAYGIELIHPIREGRSSKQTGKKGLSNRRWIVGGKLCYIINHLGQVVAWDCDTANVHDSKFHSLIEQCDQMVVLTDNGFHLKVGDPENILICKRGEWDERILVETVLSMLTVVCKFKKVGHRVWDYFKSRLAYTMAAFNILTGWRGLNPCPYTGFVKLSIANFSL